MHDDELVRADNPNGFH